MSGIIGEWQKAEIVKCSNCEYWYSDIVGRIVEVKKHSGSSWGVEERETGSQIAPNDYRLI